MQAWKPVVQEWKQAWKEYRSMILGWVAAIVVLAVFAVVSRGTSAHQLAIGLLVSSIVLAVALLVVEGLWRAAAAVGGQIDGPDA